MTLQEFKDNLIRFRDRYLTDGNGYRVSQSDIDVLKGQVDGVSEFNDQDKTKITKALDRILRSSGNKARMRMEFGKLNAAVNAAENRAGATGGTGEGATGGTGEGATGGAPVPPPSTPSVPSQLTTQEASNRLREMRKNLLRERLKEFEKSSRSVQRSAGSGAGESPVANPLFDRVNKIQQLETMLNDPNADLGEVARFLDLVEVQNRARSVTSLSGEFPAEEAEKYKEKIRAKSSRIVGESARALFKTLAERMTFLSPEDFEQKTNEIIAKLPNFHSLFEQATLDLTDEEKSVFMEYLGSLDKSTGTMEEFNSAMVQVKENFSEVMSTFKEATSAMSVEEREIVKKRLTSYSPNKIGRQVDELERTEDLASTERNARDYIGNEEFGLEPKERSMFKREAESKIKSLLKGEMTIQKFEEVVDKIREKYTKNVFIAKKGEKFKDTLVGSAISDTKKQVDRERYSELKSFVETQTRDLFEGSTLQKTILLLFKGRLGMVLSGAVGVVRKLLGVFGSLAGALGSLVSSIVDFTKKIVSTTASIGWSLLKWIGILTILYKTGLLQKIGPFITDFLRGIAPFLLKVVQSVFSAMNEFLEWAIQSLASGIGGESWGKKLKDFFFGREGIFSTEVARKTGEELKRFFRNIRNILPVLGGVIKDMITGIVTIMKDFVYPEMIKPLIDSFFEWMEGDGLGKKFKEYVYDPVTSLAKGILWLGEKIGWIIENPWKALGLYAAFRVLPSLIMSAINTAIIPLIAAIKSSAFVSSLTQGGGLGAGAARLLGLGAPAAAAAVSAATTSRLTSTPLGTGIMPAGPAASIPLEGQAGPSFGSRFRTGLNTPASQLIKPTGLQGAIGSIGKQAGFLAYADTAVTTGMDVYGQAKKGDYGDAAGVAAAGAAKAGAIWAGGKVGAAIGTAIAPGIGTAVGGLLGMAAGYLGGDALYEAVSTALDEDEEVLTPEEEEYLDSIDTSLKDLNKRDREAKLKELKELDAKKTREQKEKDILDSTPETVGQMLPGQQSRQDSLTTKLFELYSESETAHQLMDQYLSIKEGNQRLSPDEILDEITIESGTFRTQEERIAARNAMGAVLETRAREGGKFGREGGFSSLDPNSIIFQESAQRLEQTDRLEALNFSISEWERLEGEGSHSMKALLEANKNYYDTLKSYAEQLRSSIDGVRGEVFNQDIARKVEAVNLDRRVREAAAEKEASEKEKERDRIRRDKENPRSWRVRSGLYDGGTILPKNSAVVIEDETAVNIRGHEAIVGDRDPKSPGMPNPELMVNSESGTTIIPLNDPRGRKILEEYRLSQRNRFAEGGTVYGPPAPPSTEPNSNGEPINEQILDISIMSNDKFDEMIDQLEGLTKAQREELKSQKKGVDFLRTIADTTAAQQRRARVTEDASYMQRMGATDDGSYGAPGAPTGSPRPQAFRPPPVADRGSVGGVLGEIEDTSTVGGAVAQAGQAPDPRKGALAAVLGEESESDKKPKVDDAGDLGENEQADKLWESWKNLQTTIEVSILSGDDPNDSKVRKIRNSIHDRKDQIVKEIKKIYEQDGPVDPNSIKKKMRGLIKEARKTAREVVEKAGTRGGANKFSLKDPVAEMEQLQKQRQEQESKLELLDSLDAAENRVTQLEERNVEIAGTIDKENLESFFKSKDNTQKNLDKLNQVSSKAQDEKSQEDIENLQKSEEYVTLLKSKIAGNLDEKGQEKLEKLAKELNLPAMEDDKALSTMEERTERLKKSLGDLADPNSDASKKLKERMHYRELYEGSLEKAAKYESLMGEMRSNTQQITSDKTFLAQNAEMVSRKDHERNMTHMELARIQGEESFYGGSPGEERGVDLGRVASMAEEAKKSDARAVEMKTVSERKRKLEGEIDRVDREDAEMARLEASSEEDSNRLNALLEAYTTGPRSEIEEYQEYLALKNTQQADEQSVQEIVRYLSTTPEVLNDEKAKKSIEDLTKSYEERNKRRKELYARFEGEENKAAVEAIESAMNEIAGLEGKAARLDSLRRTSEDRKTSRGILERELTTTTDRFDELVSEDMQFAADTASGNQYFDWNDTTGRFGQIAVGQEGLSVEQRGDMVASGQAMMNATADQMQGMLAAGTVMDKEEVDYSAKPYESSDERVSAAMKSMTPEDKKRFETLMAATRGTTKSRRSFETKLRDYEKLSGGKDERMKTLERLETKIKAGENLTEEEKGMYESLTKEEEKYKSLSSWRNSEAFGKEQGDYNMGSDRQMQLSSIAQKYGIDSGSLIGELGAETNAPSQLDLSLTRAAEFSSPENQAIPTTQSGNSPVVVSVVNGGTTINNGQSAPPQPTIVITPRSIPMSVPGYGGGGGGA